MNEQVFVRILELTETIKTLELMLERLSGEITPSERQIIEGFLQVYVNTRAQLIQQYAGLSESAVDETQQQAPQVEMKQQQVTIQPPDKKKGVPQSQKSVQKQTQEYPD